jgi:NAD(P)-dependent dehydrogenase (short-subunit alcohol dehydrogenase family)
MITNRDLHGAVAVVTGGTAGIGRAVAQVLARAGARVLLVGRDQTRGETLGAALAAAGGTGSRFVQADLSLIADTYRLAETIQAQAERIDLLVHSAGLMLPTRQVSSEGLELVMAVQYMSRFVLTERLLSPLRAGAGRVVTITGGSQLSGPLNLANFNAEQGYNGLTRLQETGAANVLWTLDFNRRYGPTALRMYNYFPGLTRTNLGAAMPLAFRLLMGAAMPLVGVMPALAAEPMVKLMTDDLPGGFYNRRLQPRRPRGDVTQPPLQEQLRQLSHQFASRLSREHSAPA